MGSVEMPVWLRLVLLGLTGTLLGLLCFYFGVRFALASLPVQDSTLTVDLSECQVQLPTLSE